MFHAPWFVIAGLAAAAGPLVIHLLNRQRYKVVEWAAMDFLRKAVRRSRRILRLRDLLLLALRTACVMAFALALAQPYREAVTAASDPNQPVHAVLVMDDSLSMAWQQLGKTLLDEARSRAAEYVERLPRGSRVSVVPLCGSEGQFSLSAYRTKEDALEALEALRPVDRQASAAAAVDLAKEACRRVPSPAAKQIVLFTDHQAVNWRAESLGEDLKGLPAPLQIVRVGPESRDNAWVESVSVQDGLADQNVPAVVLATVRYEGEAPRSDVQVTLAVDGAAVAAQTVSLVRGQSAEVRFPPHLFEVGAEPGKPAFVPAEVSIPHDNLPDDDRRVIVVPVVAGLPAVFVDQLGPAEDPSRNQYGETFRLRRLLAPEAAGGRKQAELVQVRHVTLPKLEAEGRQLLEDARLVVVAGVQGPGTAVPLLREYVQQGGTLLIAAGAEFDPVAWNDAAWLGGLGILPAPLKPEMVGRAPHETAGRLDPFFLDFASMMGEYFFLEQESEERLKELYGRAFFFKAVAVDDGPEAREELLRNVAARIEKDRARLEEIDRRLAELSAAGAPSEAQKRLREQLEEQRAGARPEWLRWAGPLDGEAEDGLAPREAAERKVFSTLARYTRGRLPFLVEREIGRGRVLFVSSGVFRGWNNVTSEYPVVVFDRILRRALHRTLSARNLSTAERLALPVPAAQRYARFTLADPEGREETMAVDALSADRYGLTLRDLPRRGIWRVTAYGADDAPGARPETKLWEVPLAVNGPAEESDLRAVSESGIRERAGEARLSVVAGTAAVSLAGGPAAGEDFWRWLILAVFAGLLLETVVLAWPWVRGGRDA